MLKWLRHMFQWFRQSRTEAKLGFEPPRSIQTRGVPFTAVAAMADVSLGYVTAFGSDSPKRLVTASLSVDYTGSARIGDWIEARVDRSKLGKTLAFANCYITVGETQIARASAVFSVARE